MTEKEPTLLELPEAHLAELEPRMRAAIKARADNDVDKAMEILKEILQREPRLAEPQMELAGVLMDLDRLEEAEAYARDALRILENGGQWIEELPEGEVLSAGWTLLGEIMRRRADTDAIVFGDPEVWKALIGNAKAAFLRAIRLDPKNAHALEMAFGFDPDAVAAELAANKAIEDGEEPDEEEIPEA